MTRWARGLEALGAPFTAQEGRLAAEAGWTSPATGTTRRASTPDAKVAVVSDLNEFEFNPPVQLLAESLVNLVETLPQEEGYSFIFQGNAQVLDHILVSLAPDAQFEFVRLNIEFPEIPELGSDHDPLVASLFIPAQGPVFNVIAGTDRNDRLTGTDAADHFIFGQGNDFATGGAGGDLFDFSLALADGVRNIKQVLDYNPDQGDATRLGGAEILSVRESATGVTLIAGEDRDQIVLRGITTFDQIIFDDLLAARTVGRACRPALSSLQSGNPAMTRILTALVFLLAAGAASAATLLPPSMTGPRIEALDVLVENDTALGLFTADSDSVAFGGVPLDFFQLTRFHDGTGFASAGLFDGSKLLSGDLIASRNTLGALLFGFMTDLDDFGVGPLFSVLLLPGASPFPADPFGSDFLMSDARAIAAAPNSAARGRRAAGNGPWAAGRAAPPVATRLRGRRLPSGRGARRGNTAPVDP